MAAFRLAVAEGCDGVELDVHLSVDGVIVVHHDPYMSEGSAIGSLTLAEIQAIPLSDGSTVPTLGEVLSATGSLQVYIEAKSLPDSSDGDLLALMARDQIPGRLHVHAFDHRIIARLAARSPSLSLGALSSSYPVDPIAQLRDAGATTLWQEWQLIDQPLVERCRDAGVDIIAWTVNSAEAATMLATMGVSGLCGNWPDRLRRGIRNVKGAP